jgi:signal transduction histidine kinase
MEKNAKVTAGGEKHLVYKNQNGEIMVTHPNQDKGKWDTISLTEKSGAKTIKQGVKDVKDWHKYHPYRKEGISCKETIKKMFKK